MVSSAGCGGGESSSDDSSSQQEVYGKYKWESVFVKISEHSGKNEISAEVISGNSSAGINEGDTITVIAENAVDDPFKRFADSSYLNDTGMLELDSVPVGETLTIQFDRQDLSEKDGVKVIDTDWHPIISQTGSDSSSESSSK